jgi:hypothetical protein
MYVMKGQLKERVLNIPHQTIEYGYAVAARHRHAASHRDMSI